MKHVEGVRGFIFPSFHCRVLPKKLHLREKIDVSHNVYHTIQCHMLNFVFVRGEFVYLVISISGMPQRLRQQISRPRV